MYTRIALGKNRAMDVVSGESSGGSGQLLFLYPLLFALQILQCWIGALQTHVSDKWVPCLRTHPPLSRPCAEVPVSTACRISHNRVAVSTQSTEASCMHPHPGFSA